MATTTPRTTRQWILSNEPTGAIHLSGPAPTFTLTTTTLPPLQDGQVLTRVHYLSNDPGQRGFLPNFVDPDRTYVPPITLHSPMRAGVIAQVLESRAPAIPVGATVMNTHLGEWSELVVFDAAECQVLQEVPGIPVTQFLGALGGSGLTGYYGVVEVAKARPEHTLVVSGAGGSTGSMVVQVAKKMVGCKRVVGIAGTEEKCEWVRSLGADECVNYKSPTFVEDLRRATEGEVDVYFDNVGGKVLDAMLRRMKKGGTVAVCGAISTYNTTAPMELENWFEVISMRLNIKGLILFDYMDKIPKAIEDIVKAVQEGKIVLDAESETVVETGIEGVPETWMKLFEGANRGKLITKLVHTA